MATGGGFTARRRLPPPDALGRVWQRSWRWRAAPRCPAGALFWVEIEPATPTRFLPKKAASGGRGTLQRRASRIEGGFATSVRSGLCPPAGRRAFRRFAPQLSLARKLVPGCRDPQRGHGAGASPPPGTVRWGGLCRTTLAPSTRCARGGASCAPISGGTPAAR